MLPGAEGHCGTRRRRRPLPSRPRCSAARPRETIDIGAEVLRMQPGIVNEEAARLARGAELEVIMNRGTKTEFARLFGDLDWVGVDARVIMRRVKIFLVALLLLGICSTGYAQKDPPSLPADPLTDEYYQAFRGFYYDSYHLMLEVIGNDTVALPLEDFSKLSLEVQINVCLVGMDYVLFYSTMMEAVLKILKGRDRGTLVVKIFADESGISWDFERELSDGEKDKIRQRSALNNDEFKLAFGHIGNKTAYCLENRLVSASLARERKFLEVYASVPMEFQVRDIYRSQVPLIRWIQENIPESEEKYRLQTMVESMDRKYSVF